jgi:hypothetical protein
MIDLNDYSKTAAQHGWGAGWPSCGGARTGGLAVVAAPRSQVGVSVHRRIARLVGLLIAETERRGYLLRPGQCWGYACRAIAGTAVASNHCLTGETKVVTYDGPVAIRDLAGTTATLLTRDPLGSGQRGTWVDAPVRAYGTEPTHEVVLSRGGARKVLRATGHTGGSCNGRHRPTATGTAATGSRPRSEQPWNSGPVTAWPAAYRRRCHPVSYRRRTGSRTVPSSAMEPSSRRARGPDHQPRSTSGATTSSS